MQTLISIPEANLCSLLRVCSRAYADYLCDLSQKEFDRIESSVTIGADITVDRVSSGMYNYLLTPTDKFVWDNTTHRGRVRIATKAISQ